MWPNEFSYCPIGGPSFGGMFLLVPSVYIINTFFQQKNTQEKQQKQMGKE